MHAVLCQFPFYKETGWYYTNLDELKASNVVVI